MRTARRGWSLLRKRATAWVETVRAETVRAEYVARSTCVRKPRRVIANVRAAMHLCKRRRLTSHHRRRMAQPRDAVDIPRAYGDVIRRRGFIDVIVTLPDFAQRELAPLVTALPRNDAAVLRALRSLVLVVTACNEHAAG